jgi:hypothetical protein
VTVRLGVLTGSTKNQEVPLMFSYSSGSRLPGDLWIHICNGCFDVYLFFSTGSNALLKIIEELL